MIELWSINRWLRWLGVLLVVQCDGRPDHDQDRVPTKIGFMFMGWPPDRRWAEHCAREREELEG